jgi:hypothetical protein
MRGTINRATTIYKGITVNYVYCLTCNNLSFTDSLPSGLGGAKVYKVAFDGITALVNDVEQCELEGNIQHAITHQEVVNAALELYSSVIPCRFGTLFPSNSNILVFLKKHHNLLNEYLTRLEGKVEMGIKTTFNHKDKTEYTKKTNTGTGYLLRKMEELDDIRKLEQEADEFTEKLNQVMYTLWSDVKVQKQFKERTLLLSICYLVAKSNIPDFKEKYQEFKTRNPDVKLLYTGPWPPYTFANINFNESKG